MSSVITGLFSSPSLAAAAVDNLTVRGIPATNISLVASDRVDRSAFGVETHSKLPEGAALGAGAGGTIGALLAGFTAVGAVATGGLGLLAAGPLVAALAGAGAGAAAGAGVGALVGLAFPEHEIKHYEDALKKGAVIVGVECEGAQEKDTVKDVLKHFKAEKISHA